MTEARSQTSWHARFPALGRLLAVSHKKVPFVAQHSSVECGVACLAMVLAYHGKHVPREELRAVLGPTRDGVRAAHLLRTARHFGLRARGVKAEPAALRLVPRGTILHWQLNHYVVLQSVGKTYADIVDPALGPRRVSWIELDASFSGVALILEPGSDFVRGDGTPKSNDLRGRILAAGDLRRILSVSFAMQLVTLALPMLVALVVDRVLPRSDTQLLAVIAVGLALMVAFYGLSQMVRGHLLLHLRTVLDAKLTMELVERMLALPYTFFQQHSVGDLILRLESTKMVREVLTSGALAAVLDGSMMLLYLALLLVMSPLLGAVVVGLGACNVLALVAMRDRRKAFHAQLIERQAASEGFQYEMLNAVETIKAMGGEQGAVDRYCNLFVDLLNNQLAQGRLEVLFQALTSVLRLGAPLVIFTLGALEVLGGRMSVGTMLAVNTFAIGIFDPLSRLVEKVEQFERLGLHLDRMRDIHESPREQAPGKLPLHEPLSGAVALEKVSFRHGPLERDVIRDVSVTIRAGEFIGIVGASGAGKSTLVGLLLGLYKPTEGRVVYDGRSLHEIDLTSLRAQLGVVTQATQLFAGTIRSNIALSNQELSQSEVERAAQLAHIHDDIVRMPAGYDTVLASSGSSLSGGQRQRVALARALARRPALLLLDEATSALDSVSESAIQAALEKVRCTRVVIAHRLSTVAHADRILVVEAGRIVEDGAPRELLARGGAYARLVAQQMGGGWQPSAAAQPQQPQPVQHSPAAQVKVEVPAQPRVLVPPAPLSPVPTERGPARPAVQANAQHASAPQPTQKLMMVTQQGHAGVPEQIIHEIASRRAAGAHVDERRAQRPAPSRKPAEPVSVMMCRVVGSQDGQEA